MRKQLLLIFIVSLIGFGNVHSQILDPVKWTYDTRQISDNEVDLIAKATIEDKWHLYGQYFEDGGPIRLVFAFAESDKYELVGKVKESPTPTKEMDDIFGIEVQWFAKTATFTQRIKVKSESDFVLNMYLEGQACQDDGMCVPIDGEHDFQISGVKKNETTNESKTEKSTENKSQNEQNKNQQDSDTDETVVDDTDNESDKTTELESEVIDSETKKVHVAD